MTETMNFTQEWDKTFELSEEVEHKVTFTNHFLSSSSRSLSTKRGDWKTTSSRSVWSVWSIERTIFWAYAQEMAKRGYLTICF